MVIDVDAPVEIETLVAVLSLGLCAALENQSLTIDEASGYLFGPYTMSLLRRVKASTELIDLIHLGSELEDVERLIPQSLAKTLNEMKTLALSILHSLPKQSEHDYRKHWFQDVPRLVPIPLPDPLREYPPDKMLTRDEKLYRMLITAYDERGDPFWSFVQELVSINYWDNPVPDEYADAVYQATIPEAQSLMHELMQRGLVYVTRSYGFPPPSSGQFRVADAETGYVVADPQNWLGPQYEGPAALYYQFCSIVPGEAITRDSVLGA